MSDPGAYDIESTLETITLLCEQSGEPCDGPRFRELILKARAFLAARRTVSEQAAIAWQVHPFDYGIGSEGVYARTDRQEQVEAWKRKGWHVRPLVYGDAAPIPATDAETIENLIGNLLARIHRDGGHYQAEHGTSEAIKAAELEVVKLRADAEKDAALTDEQIREIWLRETGFDEKAAPFAIIDFARAILAANKGK